jgi:hypothetical protein
MQRVITMVTRASALRTLLTTGDRPYRHGTQLVLPERCGNADLVAHCFEVLTQLPSPDYGRLITRVINANATDDARARMWADKCPEMDGPKFSKWLTYGLYLGVIARLDKNDLLGLVDGLEAHERVELLIRGGREDIYEASEVRYNEAVKCLCDGSVPLTIHGGNTSLEVVRGMLYTGQYLLAFRNPQPFGLRDLAKRTQYGVEFDNNEVTWPAFESAGRLKQFVEAANEQFGRWASEWAVDLAPWDTMVEAGRRLLGDHWVFDCLATASAGIRSRDVRGNECDSLLDSRESLCKRVRFARLRAANYRWWEEQFAAPGGEAARMLVCLVFAAWAGPSCFVRLHDVVGKALEELSESQWARLATALSNNAVGVVASNQRFDIDLAALPNRCSMRLLACVAIRCDSRRSRAVFERWLRSYEGDDLAILQVCERHVFGMLAETSDDPKRWGRSLAIIKRVYANNPVGVSDYAIRYSFESEVRSMSVGLAHEIMKDAERFPPGLVNIAEGICRQDVASKMQPVGVVAESEKWFG